MIMIPRILLVLIGPPIAYIGTGLIVRHYMREQYLAGNQPAWMGALAIGICATAAVLTLCLGIWWMVCELRARKRTARHPLPISDADLR